MKVITLSFQGFKMQRIFLIGCLIFSIAVSTTANAWWVIFDEDGNPGVMGGVFFDDPKIGILCAQETYPGTDKPVSIWLSEQLEQIAQENARFTTRRGATRWREIGIRLRTKEDCVPRAARYVYILRRALAENRRYASDPDYLAFNINVVVEHIKRYEQLP